jgi:hypothetical protein
MISGTYENEYVKEDGKWKIKRIRWHLNYSDKPGVGWVTAERIAAIKPDSKFEGPTPDVPDTRFADQYPSGHTFPFHFKHPVTGKKTTEDQRNAAMKKLTGKKKGG